MKLTILFGLFLFSSCQAPVDCPTASADEALAQACPVVPPDAAPVDGGDSITDDPSTPDDDDGLLPPPKTGLSFSADISFFNFEEVDKLKVNKAIELIKRIILSEEFKSKILNFTYLNKKQFHDNAGLSNAQIYQKLLDGKEDLEPVVDQQMDLDLELYYSWRNTVGYTYPGQLTVYMNRKFFDSYVPAEVAGNVFHEWTHKLGFDHDSRYSTSRDYSVPYAIGTIIEEMAKKLK